jgi:hypothetical protein
MHYITPIILIAIIHIYRTCVLRISARNFWYLPWVLGAWIVFGLISVPLIFVAVFAGVGMITPVITTLLLALTYLFIGGAIVRSKPTFSRIFQNCGMLLKSAWLPLLALTVLLAVLAVLTQNLPQIVQAIFSVLRELFFVTAILIILKVKIIPKGEMMTKVNDGKFTDYVTNTFETKKI